MPTVYEPFVRGTHQILRTSKWKCVVIVKLCCLQAAYGETTDWSPLSHLRSQPRVRTLLFHSLPP